MTYTLFDGNIDMYWVGKSYFVILPSITPFSTFLMSSILTLIHLFLSFPFSVQFSSHSFPRIKVSSLERQESFNVPPTAILNQLSNGTKREGWLTYPILASLVCPTALFWLIQFTNWTQMSTSAALNSWGQVQTKEQIYERSRKSSRSLSTVRFV